VREVICTGLPVVIWAYMPAAEMPMPCWPPAHAEAVELRAVEQLGEDGRDLLAHDPGAVVDHGDPEARGLAGRGWRGAVARRDLQRDDHLRQDPGFLGGVERVVHRFLHAREEGLARIVEAEEMTVLGEELGDRDLPLSGAHLGRGRARPGRGSRSLGDRDGHSPP
jgi:hypothetical protein